MGLAHYSGGHCYWPGCTESVIREVEGRVHITVEIAHIRAANRNGPRYDELMTDDQRSDFRNLMLLCDPHHDLVDDKKKENFYTTEVLTRWKTQREANPREALNRLRDVTPSGLRKIVAEGLAQRDSNLLDALNRLENNDQEAAKLMRSLLDELTEAYSQLKGSMLNPDLIEQLGDAAALLDKHSEMLSEFTETIAHFDFSRIPRDFEVY
jgi:hypothetical protein